MGIRVQVFRKGHDVLRSILQPSRVPQGFHTSCCQPQQQQPREDILEDVCVEPDRPIIKTPVPGPKSEAMRKNLENVQNTDYVHFFVDYVKSQGSYVADVDGNMLLDLFSQISSLPIGYNHRRLFEVMKDKDTMTAFINRAAVGSYPPAGYLERYLQVLLSVAPKGLNGVMTTGCGTCSVENGMKAIFMGYQKRIRGDRQPSAEEKDSSVFNQLPGCPTLSFLSFNKAFHGRCMGALSMTHAKWLHKLDFPTFDWPIAPFPRLKYPLGEYIRENREEELRCLEQERNVLQAVPGKGNKVESLIFKYAKKGKPVAGICVEPIQGDGGDNHATPFFFHGLQAIAKQNGCYLMLDEIQTGCGTTGKFWAHEHFGLPHPPDVVCFSKKMMNGGFFYTDELKPTQGGRIFGTWMGDTSRLLLLEAVLDEIRDRHLLDRVADVGRYMLDGLCQLQNRHPHLVSNARGLGTMCGIDLPSTQIRDKIQKNLRHKGVNTGQGGDQSLRLRPSLLFQKKHVDVFLDIFDSVLTDDSQNRIIE